MKNKFLKVMLLTFLLIASLILACACGDDTTDSSSPSSGNSTPKESTPVQSTVDSSKDSKPADSTPSSTPSSTPATTPADSTPATTPATTPADSTPATTPATTPADSTPESTPDSEVQRPVITPEDISQLVIDYKSNTYVGTSLKDFSPLFDEQSSLESPYNNPTTLSFPKSHVSFYDADGNGDIDERDYTHEYEITVDLGAEHYIECLYVFFQKGNDTVHFDFGTPFKYEKTVTGTSERIGWVRVDIDEYSRYINIRFNNGQAPSEIYAYGAITGEYDEINTKPHEYKTFDYLLGINGNQADKKAVISCGNYFRDYVNWLWCFDINSYPEFPGTAFGAEMSSSYDSAYRSYNDNYDVRPVPCYMFRASDFYAETADDYSKPDTYVAYGEFMFQVALRYGNNKNNTRDLAKLMSGGIRINLGTIQWIEAGNEPNGEGNDGFSPYELAAFTSTAYDGHEGTVISETGSLVGVKVADPNMKLAMAGLAGVGTRYIQAMSFWMKHNRTDGQLALDAFNVHTYCKKLISFNGYQVYIGVCPEIGGIADQVAELCEWRDKYYPDKEVWMTEFGWDTNTSYETENACHPYGDYTARELQAMWLVRAYFMFASVGVDRAAMYMASDLGDEATSTGKYGTSGVIATDGTRKDSFYYIYTLKNTMGDMRFAEIIDSGNEDVWIYRFENGQGKSCYALWCPTMDNIKVDGYTLNIDGTTATLTEFVNKDEDGASTQLTVTNGTVTVNVSEKPILVFTE